MVIETQTDSPPPNGFTTQVSVVRVIDGDTVEVEFKRKFAVRLVHPNKEKLFFNSPEKNTSAGKKAIETSKSLLPTNKEVTLFLPANKPLDLLDIESFNRVLGQIWVDGKRYTTLMLETGDAKLVKREDIGKNADQG